MPSSHMGTLGFLSLRQEAQILKKLEQVGFCAPDCNSLFSIRGGDLHLFGYKYLLNKLNSFNYISAENIYLYTVYIYLYFYCIPLGYLLHFIYLGLFIILFIVHTVKRLVPSGSQACCGSLLSIFWFSLMGFCFKIGSTHYCNCPWTKVIPKNPPQPHKLNTSSVVIN